MTSTNQYETGHEFPVEATSIKQTFTVSIPEKGEGSEARKLELLWIAIFAHVTGMTYILWDCGVPADTWTWAWLFIYVAILLSALWTWKLRRNRLIHGILGMALVSLLVPYQSDWLLDIPGGRRGAEIRPWSLVFSKGGRNTAILEDHLGPLDAEWRFHELRSNTGSGLHVSHQETNSHNLIYQQELQQILEILPTRKARMQVLRCLTDSSNIMRFHQGLLLACLYVKGFPKGFAAENWWQTHEWIFVSEHSGMRAARITQLWVRRGERYLLYGAGELENKKLQLLRKSILAARFHEGSWGEGPLFPKSWPFNEDKCPQKTAKDLKRIEQVEKELENKNSVWWP
ncbi:MAG: hypothetical protein P1V97_25885 [Planctomycetota bacterium]|nr:hypothetical protein [Planctomycetota bacterium]